MYLKQLWTGKLKNREIVLDVRLFFMIHCWWWWPWPLWWKACGCSRWMPSWMSCRSCPPGTPDPSFLKSVSTCNYVIDKVRAVDPDGSPYSFSFWFKIQEGKTWGKKQNKCKEICRNWTFFVFLLSKFGQAPWFFNCWAIFFVFFTLHKVICYKFC